MKTIILIIGLLVIAAVSLNAQNVWQVNGNHINGNSGILGSTNKKPIKFITNDNVRLLIQSDGDAEFKKTLYVKEGLVVGDSALSVFASTAQGPGFADFAVTDIGKFSLGAGSLNNPMYNSEFFFGIGGSYNAYKVQIHQQAGRSNPAILGFTNNFTLHSNTDGFTIGLPGFAGTEAWAEVNQKEKAPMLFKANNIPRLTINQETVLTDRTRISIHSNNYNPAISPVSLLNFTLYYNYSLYYFS